ncbi:hypothetical protein EJ03DRAFT_328584 [Teratosphaeria nubilosa]|uniref:Uncharacterized protein n=1 Tax=Teratosphaeria nubilosa TaxID=161662 RepID=A0A6G1L6H2_9PEZI|nr:hypothetical protein EJ03DRAFT_328584 [Teratosphaeria nubilosa]
MHYLLPLLTLVPLTLATKAGDTLGQCADVNPDVLNAIGIFCSGSDHITVPSTYAKNGGYGGPTKQVHVWIDGGCSPPQWVPKQYCMTQFEQLCAEGYESRGAGQGTWGNSGCQIWTIEP